MRRVLLNLLTLLSLLLCMAVVTLWVRSYRTGDSLLLSTYDQPYRGTTTNHFEFRSHRGWFEITEPGGWPSWYWKEPYWPFVLGTAAIPSLWTLLFAATQIRNRRRVGYRKQQV